MLPIRERQIRVFIPSTFRDVQAERDHLMKFIFPKMRKLCESRQVTWDEGARPYLETFLTIHTPRRAN